jgi:hypothetical protein
VNIRIISLCAVFAGSLFLGAGRAFSGTLPPEDEVPEMMMETQGLICIGLGVQYGPSEDLHFTSNTDISNLAFNFALVSGSTYAGQPATITASGAFNSSTDLYDLAASGSVGGDNFSITGTGQDPMHFYNFYQEWDWDFLDDELIISNVTYDQTATRTVSQGTFTVKSRLTGIVKSTSTHYDTYVLQGDGAGTWEWNTTEASTPNGRVKASSTGYAPVGGGAGQFITSVTVPEPQVGLLIASLLLAGRATRRSQGGQLHDPLARENVMSAGDAFAEAQCE